MAVSLTAAVLSGLLVYGVYLLQLRQVRLQETVDVVVPRQFVAMGTTLSREQLTKRSLPRGAVTEDMMTSVEEVDSSDRYTAAKSPARIPLDTDFTYSRGIWNVASPFPGSRR
jgi:Flp pilus assembly protein CpaB